MPSTFCASGSTGQCFPVFIDKRYYILKFNFIKNIIKKTTTKEQLTLSFENNCLGES